MSLSNISRIGRICIVSFLLCSAIAHSFAYTLNFGRSSHQASTEHVVGQTVTYGGSIIYLGQYYVNLNVGGQNFNVQFDTGSSGTAIPDSECNNCHGNGYNAGSSSTFSPVPCSGSQFQCRQCSDISGFSNQCSASESFGDGSGLVGVLAQDRVSLGDGLTTTAPFIRILREVNGFGNDVVPGIFGAAYSRLNCNPTCTPTILDALHSDPAVNMSYVFGMCLSVNGGALDIGKVASERALTPLQYVPVDNSHGFYEVTMNDISVGSTSLGSTAGSTTIVDSGTTLVVVPNSWFSTFKNYFLSADETKGLPAVGDLFGSTGCACMSESDVRRYPDLHFRFPGETGSTVVATLKSYHYIIPISGQYCVGIVPISSDLFILGDVFLQSQYTVFDQERNRVGFAPVNTANCPGDHTLPVANCSGGSGISSGAIVAIAVGAAAGLALLALCAAVMWCLRRRRNNVAGGPNQNPPPPPYMPGPGHVLGRGPPGYNPGYQPAYQPAYQPGGGYPGQGYPQGYPPAQV